MMSRPPGDTAASVVELARDGRFADVCDLFAPALRPMVTPDALRVAWERELAQQGQIISVGEPITEPAGPGAVVVRLPITCANGTLTAIVSVSATGFLVGLQLAPPEAAAPTAPWEPPDYVDAASFDEEEVIVGAAPLSVPGTLSLPHRPGPNPAVVVLGGSGPLDRDGTIGRSKPLKDLAWGIATCGVAVLRFDKVTFAHSDEVRRTAGFTLADEYLPQAAAALDLLRRHPHVDPERVFPLGHSLGGTRHHGPRQQAGPSPDWSSSPAAPSRCSGRSSVGFATWPRSTLYRPASRSPGSPLSSSRRGGSTAPSSPRRRPRPSCLSACRPPTGWTCATTTRLAPGRPRPPSTSPLNTSTPPSSPTSRRGWEATADSPGGPVP